MDDVSAMLTPKQRQYLKDPENADVELGGASERMLRSRIRKRAQITILSDMSLLLEAIDDGPLDAEKIADVNNDDYHALALGLKSQVALSYQLSKAAGLKGKQIVKEGLEEGRTSRAKAIYKRFQKRPRSLTLGEYGLLRREGLIDEDEYKELFQETLRDPLGYVSPEEASENVQEWHEEALEEEDASQ